MSSPAWTFLPDLVEEHLEEIQFLWPIRDRGLRSPRMTLRDVHNFEERIDAHVDGALVPGDDALPFIDPLLESGDELAAFAAVFTLLRHGTDGAISRVRSALTAAKDKQLAGVGRALQVGRSGPLIDDLGGALRGEDPARALIAAEALCYHVRWKGSHDRLLAFLGDEDPATKRSGWRIVANLAIPADPKRYAAAMRDDDASVRESALLAAAWTGVPGALAIARAAATTPSKAELPAYRLLAAIGDPGDLAMIQRLVQTPELGPDRFALAAAFGSPALGPLLLDALASDDPRTAIAAGEAFTRLTGADLGPGERITLPPEDGHEPDEFEQEFLDDATLPDVAKARAHWNRVGASLAPMTRVAHGRDVTAAIPPDAFAWLDMQSRYEWWMRARFRGTWTGSPMQLEVFPQR